MNPEERLRALSDEDRWDASSPAPDIARFRRRRRGRLVRRAAATVLVLACVGGGVGALAARPSVQEAAPAAPSRAAASTSSVVPWTDAPPTQVQVLAGSAVSTAPACTATDFSYSFRADGTVMGSVRAPLYVTQISSRSCAITKPFSIQTIRHGVRTTTGTVSLTQMADAYGLPKSADQRIVLPPRLKITLRVTSSDGNGIIDFRHTVPAWLNINGHVVHLTGELPKNAVDATGAELTIDAPPSPQETGRGPFSQLHAQITVPDSVRAGEVLDYRITLTNTSDRVFTYGDCPTYLEEANVFPGGSGTHLGHTEGTYTLNCSPGSTIAAGAQVTYAMRIPIANATGPLRMGWFMTDGPSTATQAAHGVTR